MSHARLLVPVVLLAAIGGGYAVWTTTRLRAPEAPPLAETPPAPAYADRVCGTGLLEPSGRAVRVGVPEAGIVDEVLVAEGDDVTAGAALLRLDDRMARAECAQLEAAVAVAVAERERLVRLPRVDDVPPLAAAAAETAARLQDARQRRVRGDALAKQRLISEEEAEGRRQAESVAATVDATAQAQLERARSPAWAPDLAVAQGRIDAATAALATARQRLERLTVRALSPGVVLAVRIRAGERAEPGAEGGVLLLGSRTLDLRIDIDESLAARLRPGAPARAWVRGVPDRTFTLKAVRTEPLAVGKRALSGATLEREDARVVQLLYRVGADGAAWLRPGMMMEAEIDTAAAGTAKGDGVAKDEP